MNPIWNHTEEVKPMRSIMGAVPDILTARAVMSILACHTKDRREKAEKVAHLLIYSRNSG
jgi:hypothetical protein